MDKAVYKLIGLLVTLVLVVLNVGCTHSAFEETQITPEQARIKLDIPFLSRLDNFRTVYETRIQPDRI